MKKTFFIAIFMVAFSFISSAQQNTEQCPLGGRENCTGYCGLFTDGNKDGYCDYALLNLKTDKNRQTNKENDTKQSTEKSPIPEPTTVKVDSSQNNVAPASNRDYGNPTFDSLQSLSPTVEEANLDSDVEKSKSNTPYHFWILLLLTLGLYACTFFLVEAKKMKKISHRKIWNCVLLITCLVSCLLGLYIVLAKMYDWSMNYMTVLKLHVDFGIVMTIIAIIHIVWHWRYFKNMLKHRDN